MNEWGSEGADGGGGATADHGEPPSTAGVEVSASASAEVSASAEASASASAGVEVHAEAHAYAYAEASASAGAVERSDGPPATEGADSGGDKGLLGEFVDKLAEDLVDKLAETLADTLTQALESWLDVGGEQEAPGSDAKGADKPEKDDGAADKSLVDVLVDAVTDALKDALKDAVGDAVDNLSDDLGDRYGLPGQVVGGTLENVWETATAADKAKAS